MRSQAHDGANAWPSLSHGWPGTAEAWLVPRAAEGAAERRDEVGEGVDLAAELAVVAPHDVGLMGVARAARPHRVALEQLRGLRAGVGHDVVADQLESIERRAVLGDDLS